jgi:hypothetical protein
MRSRPLPSAIELRSRGWREAYAEVLQEVAAVAEPADAARLLAASDRLLGENAGRGWDPADYDRTVAATRMTLGDEAFDNARREGHSLDEDRAFEIALRALQ